MDKDPILQMLVRCWIILIETGQVDDALALMRDVAYPGAESGSADGHGWEPV